MIKKLTETKKERPYFSKVQDLQKLSIQSDMAKETKEALMIKHFR